MDADLLSAAGWTLLAVVLVLARPLGARAAFLLALVKVGLVFVYFGWLDDGRWRLYDDLAYARDSGELVAEGNTPVLLAATGEGQATLFAYAGGSHVVYYVYNVLAVWLFGDHYWSPILLNVFATALAALALARILEQAGWERTKRRVALIFFLLHWDLLAWSSFVNLKDSLVLALTAWLFATGLTLGKRLRILDLSLFGLCLLLLAYLRWYVPALVAVVLVVFGLFDWRGWRRALVVGLAGAAVSYVAWKGIPSGYLEPAGAIQGAIRFVVTPRPWGIEERYSFLTIPAALHWLFLPVLLLGCWSAWRRSPLLRPLILWLCVLVLFYGLVPELQGPRHRYQAAFATALLQFEGLAFLVREAFGERSRRSAGVAPAAA